MAARSTASTKKQTPSEEMSVAQTKPENKAEEIRPVEIDIHQYIPVRNGFQGTLVYVSKRTGEQFIWDHFGDEQDMELQELKNAKSSGKAFFERNWFMFDDEYSWVIDYLGVRAFYRNALKVDEFDELFTMSADQVKKRIEKLSDGQKASVAYRASQLIGENRIDSMSVIGALEDALKVRLIDR